MTAADVELLVRELADARFVLLDTDHAEVAVRSFVKNDGFAGRWQMVSAMWQAWEAVSSPMLKEALVREMPDDVWAHEKAKAPAMALAIRLAMADAMPTPAPTPASTPGAPIDFDALRSALR